MSDKTSVCPADTDTGGISFLAADLGSVGTLVSARGCEGTESVTSMEMGNWMWGKILDFRRRTEKVFIRKASGQTPDSPTRETVLEATSSTLIWWLLVSAT